MSSQGFNLFFVARNGSWTQAGFRYACDVLARLIDISLTMVFLLSDVVLAASLGFMIAGQIVG